MLSYMVPIVEKPSQNGENSNYQINIGLESESIKHDGTRMISDLTSKDTSVNSFISDVTTTTASSMTPTSTSDKAKSKLIFNGTKHQNLKRVSFGSSKGSMVETLIFESSTQEEDKKPESVTETLNHLPEDQELNEAEQEREKVRVTFFQQSKPQEVDLPDELVHFDENDFMMSTTVAMNNTNHIIYNRTESCESGWDNPFRPGGDLSREADEIVELIKGGKPITPTPGATSPPLPLPNETGHQTNNQKENVVDSPKNVKQVNATPKSAKNGNVQNDNNKTGGNNPSSPTAVVVQRGHVQPENAESQVEHITIKKKPKCECCVIQ